MSKKLRNLLCNCIKTHCIPDGDRARSRVWMAGAWMLNTGAGIYRQLITSASYDSLVICTHLLASC